MIEVPAEVPPTVVVTGCAGFIGARTAHALLDSGRTVVGIDDLSDGYDPSLKRARLALLRAHLAFTFQEADVARPGAVDAALDATEAHWIYHLAARAGVRQSLVAPDVYYRTNVDGTREVLEAARRAGVRGVTIASTSSVYAKQSAPFREDSPADRPLSPYAASKRAAELLAHAYVHLYGIDVAVPRYFTVYGPAGRPDMSVYRAVRCIAEGEPFTLRGTGEQSRDFTFVDDIARGTIATAKIRGYEVVNLGNDDPRPLTEVFRILEQVSGRRLRLQHLIRHPADIDATWADVSKATRLLGWRPRVTLEEGLRRTYEWYVQNRDWAVKVDTGEAG